MAENNSSAPFLPALATYDELPEAVIDAVAAALGDAYDCLRVWSAWSYGTMGPDDFGLVAEDGERIAEIARAAIEAYVAVTQAVEAQAPAAVAVPDEREMVIQNVMKLVANWGITGHSADFEVMFKAWVAIETALRAALAATPALPATEDSSAGDLAEPAAFDATFTNRVIEALQENGDPVSVDAAEEMAKLRDLLLAAPQAQPADALLQHHRDSAELSRLCVARDHARRERDLCKAEIAGLQSSCANLGRLVDELRPKADRYDFLREQDLDAIKIGGVFAGKTPDNVVLNGGDLDAAIDAAMAAAQEGGKA